MRNLFQLNVEEARHLWAIAYLLRKYLGREGRDAAEGLLRRRAGNAEPPRILGAFNEEIPDWLSFYLFSFFTDRDVPITAPNDWNQNGWARRRSSSSRPK
jgi:benzoyl-CoA 2,3-dioxygenase component B